METGLSTTNAWIIGTLPDEAIDDALQAAVQAGPPQPPSIPVDLSGGLARWRSRAHESLFSTSETGRLHADDDAFRLSVFLDSCLDDSQPAAALRDAVMERFPAHGTEGLFAAVARKASPFSALAYALGPDATLQLPGWFGDFLLTAEEVRAQLPAAEQALALTGTQRRNAVERIHAWLTGLGDAPDHDAEELLDGPLRVLHHAARTGQGAAGQVRRY